MIIIQQINVRNDRINIRLTFSALRSVSAHYVRYLRITFGICALRSVSAHYVQCLCILRSVSAHYVRYLRITFGICALRSVSALIRMVRISHELPPSFHERFNTHNKFPVLTEDHKIYCLSCLSNFFASNWWIILNIKCFLLKVQLPCWTNSFVFMEVT